MGLKRETRTSFWEKIYFIMSCSGFSQLHGHQTISYLKWMQERIVEVTVASVDVTIVSNELKKDLWAGWGG